MPQSILELIFKSSKQGAGGKQAAAELKELKSGVGELSSSLLGVNLASVGVIGVITAIGAGAKAAVSDTVAYAEQVRDLGRISGASAEDTSRLIQVSDDLKVEYSTLEQAAKALAKNGIALTTEELAKASDKYLSYTTAGERAEYATKTFGKAGLELTKILEQGGDAIRTMAAEQSGALILNQKQVDQARRLEVAEDAVSDSFMAIKVTVGNALIPVLADAITTFDDLLNITDKVNSAALAGSHNYHEYAQAVIDETQAQMKGNEILAVLSGIFPQLTPLIAANVVKTDLKAQADYDAAKAADFETRKLHDLENAVDNSGAAALIYANQVGDAGTGTGTYAAAIADATKKNEEFYTSQSTKVNPSVNDASLLMQTYTTQLLYNQAAAGLDKDAALLLAASMGLIDEKTWNAMDGLDAIKQRFLDGKIDAYEYAREVAQLGQNIDGLHDKSVTVTYNQVTAGASPRAYGGGYVDPGTGSHYAEGGSFRIPENYGYEGYPLGPGKTASGGEIVTVTPKGKGGSPLVGTVIINNGMDQASFERMLMRATGR